MLLWAGGMALNMIDTVRGGDATETPQISLLLYVVYGVPLVFVLARARRERWAISLIDALLAALLGVLFFLHTRFHANAGEAGMNSVRLLFDIQNACIAAFALLRWASMDLPDRRAFFRVLAIYALAYLLVAGYINHFAEYSPFGQYADLLIDLPFLVLAVLAPRAHESMPAVERSGLRHAVQAGGPMILPLLLLVVAALVVDHARDWALAGFVAAIMGFGLRSMLLQIGLLERQAALDALSRLDGLTGVANRRQFDAVLQTEWNRACRQGSALSLLLIDIDHFKWFNDRHGHPAGDRCLQQVAAVLQATAARGGDLVARYGGEEFAVVAPATHPDSARELGERLRAAIQAIPGDVLPQMVTISVGVAWRARARRCCTRRRYCWLARMRRCTRPSAPAATALRYGKTPAGGRQRQPAWVDRRMSRSLRPRSARSAARAPARVPGRRPGAGGRRVVLTLRAHGPC
jgi:diguanylate cyclase (GGDEF)-like protein